MTLHERQTFLELFYSGCLAITASKGKDYNPDDIPLLDVLETAVDKNDTIPGVLWVYYRKHVTAIKKHFFHNAPLESEPILSRLQDASNFIALLAFYEIHKRELHAAWRAHWGAKRCHCEFEGICQRCETLAWLEKAAFGIGSETSSSPSTRRAPD